MALARWTPEEDAILRDIYAADLSPRYRTAVYAQRLPGRTTAAINHRAQVLQICRSIRHARKWTAREDKKIKAEWHGSKTIAVLAGEMNRSASSLQNRAKKLDIKNKQVHAPVEITPELDAAIRAGYGGTRYGFCKRIADQFGVSTGWVKIRGRQLGLTRVSNNYVAKWTEAEDALLESLMEKGGLRYIHDRMKAAGYVRSLPAIQQRAYSLGMSWVNARDAMTATQLAQCMGVDSSIVARWVKCGKLRGSKENFSGLHDLEQPHSWMIQTKHIRQFLIDHVGSYKLGSVDRFWFVSIVAGDKEKPMIQHSAGKGYAGAEEYGVAA